MPAGRTRVPGMTAMFKKSQSMSDPAGSEHALDKIKRRSGLDHLHWASSGWKSAAYCLPSAEFSSTESSPSMTLA